MLELAKHEVAHACVMASYLGASADLIAIRFGADGTAITLLPDPADEAFAISAAGPAWVAGAAGHWRAPYVFTLTRSPDAVYQIAEMTGKCPEDLEDCMRLGASLSKEERQQLMRWLGLYGLQPVITQMAAHVVERLQGRPGIVAVLPSSLIAVAGPALAAAGDAVKARLPFDVAVEMMTAAELPDVSPAMWIPAAPQPETVEERLAASGILIGGVA